MSNPQPVDSLLPRIYIVTDWGTIPISPSTIAAMNASYPGWDDPQSAPRGDRRKRAEQGAELFERAAKAIAQLAWCAQQELVSL